jgi:hypothetical protein
MNSCIHAGLRWLTRSGIQDESGGVARYYMADSREYKNISAGSTGSFISALLRLQWHQGEPPPGPALRAGHFLIEHAFDNASDLFFYERGNSATPPPALAYFFDCGIIIRGLLDLWSTTGDRAYLDHAERCGMALCGKMSIVDGSFFPLYDIAMHHPHSGSGVWSVEPGVYQLKVGLAFLELAEATGLGQFKATTESLRKWALKRQESFLRDETEEPQLLMDRAHAYCYFLEGLLPEAALDRDCSQALQFGLLSVENLVEEIGGQFERCDVLAQMLRLRLYADIMGVMELSRGRADQEATRIAEFQMQSPDDPKIDGGFAFARRRGELVRHLNPATTAQAVQALQMWDQAEDGGFRQSWKVLI